MKQKVDTIRNRKGRKMKKERRSSIEVRKLVADPAEDYVKSTCPAKEKQCRVCQKYNYFAKICLIMKGML